MKPADLFRIVRELEAQLRRIYQHLARAGEDAELLADGVSRLRKCLELIEAGEAFTPPQLDPLAPSEKPDGPRRPRQIGSAPLVADPAPRVISKMEITMNYDGSAKVVLHGERPGETRRIRLPAAPAELLLVLAANDGRPRLGDCVSAKPNSELMRKLHTRDGESLSYVALKQRVHVLRRHLVERGGLHRDVLADVRIGGEPGYRLAYRLP